ncbi:MAG: hypothetical protein HC822_01800 [Oscillochloris sp.]|nr:hypothetical protein [Oscillochloris sp.]
MRFPLLNQCRLPCVFEQFVPGKLHPDGRRYLPQLILRPTADHTITPAGFRLLVVDRHHRVDPQREGQAGIAQLVFALSAIRLQEAPVKLGLLPNGNDPQAPSHAPLVFGQVQAVAAWERQPGELPYESLYLELLLDIGLGTIGLRTNVTAPRLADVLGAERIDAGDAVALDRSRIDILGFA